jgi:hypothetical protein
VEERHHTEEFTYFDVCDGGLYTLTGSVSASEHRRVWQTSLSFQLVGVPLDTSPPRNVRRAVGVVPEGSKADIDAAIAAARKAFDDPQGWSMWEPAGRAEVLERFAVALEKRGEETERRVAVQNGMRIWLAQQFERRARRSRAQKDLLPGTVQLVGRWSVVRVLRQCFQLLDQAICRIQVPIEVLRVSPGLPRLCFRRTPYV